MTVNIGGATISGGITVGTAVTQVTSGLVLNLDAGNVSSYPGTGATWYDLSGYSNNGTLSNSPTYSDGSLVLNGVNQYASIVSTSGFPNRASESVRDSTTPVI